MDKVYLVTVFYDNMEDYTASTTDKAFSTAEKATEYVKNWQAPENWGVTKVEEVPDLVSETDIRVIKVETEKAAYSGLYYFSIKEMEVL